MSKTFKILASLSVLIVVFPLVFVFRPLGPYTLANSEIASGKIVKVFEASTNDIVFFTNMDKNSYYINRGTEKGLKANDFRDNLQNKEVTIYYAKNSKLTKWLLKDPERDSRHITRIECEGEIYYDEIGGTD